jgi:hypothetical protein
MKLLLQSSVLLIIGSLAIDGIPIQYNGLIHYFAEEECTVSIIADCFNLDASDDMYLKCDCGSYIYPNDDGLFENLDSDAVYTCNGDEDSVESECSCNDLIEVDLDPMNNWYFEGDHTIRAIRQGNIVLVTGTVAHANKPYTQIFQLPDGFKPIHDVTFRSYNRAAQYGTSTLTISTDGVAKITSRSGVSAYVFYLDGIVFATSD